MAHSLFKMLATAASSLRMTPWRKREKALPPETCFSHQGILDSFPFPVALVNPQGKIMCVNKCWVESRCPAGVLGESSIEPGIDYLDVCRRAAAGCSEVAEAPAGIQGVCDGSIPYYELSCPYLLPDGEHWFLMAVTPLRTNEGGAVIIHRDITDLKQARDNLQGSEERLLLIADKAPAMIWMAAADRRCVYVNKQWLDFTGRKLDQELGDGWLESIHPDYKEKFLAAYGEAFEKLQTFKFEYRVQCAGGEFRWVLNTGVPLFRGNGELVGLIGSCIDITDRRAAEEILINLGGRLIAAQEEERSRIARELHDDLSQRMALLSIEIDQLAQRASEPEVIGGLRQALNQVQEASGEIHRLSYELHPSKLDRLGLAAASLSLCREVSKQQSVRLDCEFRDIPDSLPRNISLCLYRVIQESLQNIIRHSGAYNGSVELYGLPSEIRLIITDEGVGFNPDSIGKKGGLGLLSMRERLRLVGGTLSIESQPLRGTRVNVTVPINAGNSERTQRLNDWGEIVQDARPTARESGHGPINNLLRK